MAKVKDYIVDISKSEVSLMGQVIATFNPQKRDEVMYVGDNKKRTRWINQAIKMAPALGEMRAESVKDDDGGITWEEVELVAQYETDFYDLFPGAPRPFLNNVGREHKEIFDWIIKNYPNFEPQLFPEGPYDPYIAGVEGNHTITPRNPSSSPAEPTMIN